ncbi:hemicentin-1-like isoform X1 [Lytechinus pictus]|uniref:hemicentin-1-like isoform X1 n=1 Tax=Lytechinus pictus TaxID=7653 RepID=UPI0030B9C530
MIWFVCLCGYLVFDFSYVALGLRLHSNPDGKETSMAGKDASLTCYYSPALSSPDQFDSLFWKFSPKNDPANEVELASYRVSMGIRYNSGLSSKLRLNASWQYGGLLTIMNTTLDDQGDYTCQVATLMGFEDSIITLTVYAVPRYLQIYDASHQLIDHTSPLQIASGEPYIIFCAAFPASSPAANLSWQLDPTLKVARNMIYAAPENVTSLTRPSSSSSSARGWEFFATERRLVLTPRDEDHGAIIRCSCDHIGLREDLSVSITLSVLVSPSYIRVYTGDFRPLTDTGSLNVSQDSEVSFVCMSTRSRPATVPRWWIGDDEITDDVTRTVIPYDDQDLYDVSSRLTLGKVLRQYHGKAIACSASALNLRPVETNFTLLVLGPPDPPQIRNISVAVTEGRSSSLECVALHGYPPADIEWLIDGYSTSDFDTVIVKRWRYDLVSRLTIHPNRTMNGKEVTCIVRFPSVQPTEMNSSVSLNVSFCPYSLSISCQPVSAGQPSDITCRSALGNPAPSLLWTLDGQGIEDLHVNQSETSSSSNTTMGFFSSSLFSRSFDADDHGKLVRCCAARNVILGCTEYVCAECPLNVYCKPKLLQSGNDMVKSRHEYYITLSCSARGNPYPSIEWYSPWMVQDSPINASTPGVISLVDTIIDGGGSDRVTVQSTLVIESSAGIDAKVQGVRCEASNSIGSTYTVSFFGNASDISSVYDPRTGLLTVRYDPDFMPALAAAIPCVHVDYKLASTQAWKWGATCFRLQTNETVVQVQSGLENTELGLRVCFYEEFCSSPLPPRPSFQKSTRPINILLVPILVGAAIGGILCFSGGFIICRKRSKKGRTRSIQPDDRGDSRRIQNSSRRRPTEQSLHAGEGVAAISSPIQIQRGFMNHYMDMGSSALQGAASSPQTLQLSPFTDPGHLFAYEDMRVDGLQPSSPGLAHYAVGSQSVDTVLYTNMLTSTPLKRADSGICCTYSVSPPKPHSPRSETDPSHAQNTYESAIFTTPALKLQMPPPGKECMDTYAPMSPSDGFKLSPSPGTVAASEWSFVPTEATPMGGRSPASPDGTLYVNTKRN